MQVTLFKALRSVNIDDTQATAVVEQLEEYIAVKIADVTKTLEAQNRTLQAQITSLEKTTASSDSSTRWVIGLFGFVIALASVISAAGLVLTKFVH